MIVNEEAVKKILEEVKPAKLVAATKYVDVKEIEKLEKLGVTCFGENRVQAFLEKYEKISIFIFTLCNFICFFNSNTSFPFNHLFPLLLSFFNFATFIL